MVRTLALALGCLLSGIVTAQETTPPPLFSFGVMADVQYADKDTAGSRHYRASLQRLEECIADLGERDLAFTIQLGDFVDDGPESFGPVLEAWRTLPGETHHVIGNHDFPRPRREVMRLLGLTHGHYDFAPAEGWRVVVLDGMDLSLRGYPDDHPKRAAAAKMLADTKATGAKNAQAWNGGVGPEQLEWLDATLTAADEAEERVIVCCHFPVLEAASSPHHLLWNHAEVRRVLAGHASVIAWFNGHDHAGGYAAHDGVHHLTFSGMVETPKESAYAVVDVFGDRLEVRGVGRQRSLSLALR